MDSEYIQQVRYKLQKRLKRLNSSGYQTFHFVLKQTWGYLQESEITKGILDDLERRSSQKTESDADKILNGQRVEAQTESENDLLCYLVVKKCVLSERPNIEHNAGHSFGQVQTINDSIENFRQNILEPLFDYIDEQIDDKRMTLVLLRKYKHRSEWFRRADLCAKLSSNTKQGESGLADDLYEYLYDQGIEFHIEPHSASGRPDLISVQSGKDRLVADVKIFDGESRGVTYIVKGFRQVYEYTKDYNESFGYLVIFKTCEKDLAIITSNQESSVPFVTHNGKTIFFVVIDIFDYPESASKRGKLEAYEITAEQLVQNLAESVGEEPSKA